MLKKAFSLMALLQISSMCSFRVEGSSSTTPKYLADLFVDYGFDNTLYKTFP